MKIISVWQPFAQLLVTGCKIFETRTWPAPKSLIGQRIAIASTKTIRPEQREWVQDAFFQECYERALLPSFDDLPHGYVVGTVILDSMELMTPDFMSEVSAEEKAYGHWAEGNYAWRMLHPIALKDPVPIRGQQGIYDWKRDDQDHSSPDWSQVEARKGDDGAPRGFHRTHLQQPVEEIAPLRSHLRLVR